MYYLYICAYAEFHSILIPVMFSVEINSSQPNYFSIPSVTDLARSTSDKT